jgi:hypothetical protein
MAERPVLEFPSDDLQRLTAGVSALNRYRVVAADFNTAKTVTVALPRGTSSNENLVLATAPIRQLPTTTSSRDTVIAALRAWQSIPISPNTQAKPDAYLVILRTDGAYLIDEQGAEFGPIPSQQVQMTARYLEVPEATMTVSNMTYAWGNVQVYVQLPPTALIPAQALNEIRAEMDRAVDTLKSSQKLSAHEEIAIETSIPDVLGATAVNLRQPSLLMAVPPAWAEGQPPDTPIPQGLLAVFSVLLPVDGLPDLPEGPVSPGAYVVRSRPSGSSDWMMELIPPTGPSRLVAAKYLPQVRVLVDRPEAILVDCRVVLCWGEC